MSTNDTLVPAQDLFPTSEITTAAITTAPDAPEQLSLLAGSVPLQFRLDERTRRAGLQHVAALRQQMVAQAAARCQPAKSGNGPAARRTGQIAA